MQVLVPLQGICAVSDSPQVLEVAKHDMGGARARPIAPLGGGCAGQGVKAKQLVQVAPALPATRV